VSSRKRLTGIVIIGFPVLEFTRKSYEVEKNITIKQEITNFKINPCCKILLNHLD
jgi:hypothetical protein